MDDLVLLPFKAIEHCMKDAGHRSIDRIPPLARILHGVFEELWKKIRPILAILNEIKEKKKLGRDFKERSRKR